MRKMYPLSMLLRTRNSTHAINLAAYGCKDYKSQTRLKNMSHNVNKGGSDA